MKANKFNLQDRKGSADFNELLYFQENADSQNTFGHQGDLLTSNEIILIIYNILVSVSNMCSSFLLIDKFIENSGTNINPLVFNSMVKTIAALFNPLVGSLADSLTGKFYVVVLATWSLTISNLLCVLANIEIFSSNVNNIIYQCAVFALFCFRSSCGTKHALLYSQYIKKEVQHKLDYFIFLTVFWTYFIKMFVATGFFVSSFYNPMKLICNSIGAISGFVAFLLLIYCKNQLQPEQIDSVLVKCIMTKLKSTNEDNHFYSRIGENSWKMSYVLITTVGFFMSAYMLTIVVISECSLSEEEQTYVAKLGTMIITFMLLTVMTAFVYYSFLNVFRRWKVDYIYLRLTGIAYNFMGISMILLCLAVSSLRSSTDWKGEAHLRLYNGMNETVIIRSSLCEMCLLHPGKLREILHIPCTVECNFQIQIEFLQTRRIITAQLRGEEVQSYTYIIRENTVVKIRKRDPVKAPIGMSTFFVFANVDILQGLLIFDDQYPVSLVKNLTDHVIITIPSISKFSGFKYKLRDEVYNDSTFKLASGKVYSIYVHVIGNITTYEANVVKLDFSRRLNPFLLFLPTLINQFAFILARLCLPKFVVLESPEQTVGFLMGVMQMSMDVGIVSWTMSYRLNSTWIVVLFIFTLIHILSQFFYSKCYTSYIIWSRKQKASV